MDRIRQSELLQTYRDGLLNDTLRFWFPRCLDRECGGYLTCFDRDGNLLQSDKAVWLQGRIAWLLSTLYDTVERREEWLSFARFGIEFIQNHCIDRDGRLFFWVTREGLPLRKRRYLFSESFAVIALAAYGRAAGDERYGRQAFEMFRLMLRYHETPGLLEPKTNPATRPCKGLAMPMILIATAQELRKSVPDPLCDTVIDRSIAEIESDFLKPEFRCVLEMVGPSGEFYDTFDGRLINPGHSMEAGWFILEEARHRGGDPHLVDLGTQIIDWSFERGWDPEFGGILYFRDAREWPVTEYWHDMKFWWPHNEAIIANLLAYHLTRNEKFSRRHTLVHDWAYSHFPDPAYGEWFAYLRRDGALSSSIKGNMWKGPFHLGRMQWYCWKILEEMIAAGS